MYALCPRILARFDRGFPALSHQPAPARYVSRVPADAAPLTLFGPDHIGALLATLGTACLAAGLLRLPGPRPLRIALIWLVCGGLAGVLAAVEIGGVVDRVRSRLPVADVLPLHLCDFAAVAGVIALLGIAAALTRASLPALAPLPAAWRAAEIHSGAITLPAATRAAYELAYFWSLGGSVQALLTPEIHDTFPSLAFIAFFAGHGAGIAAVVALTVGLGLRPRPRSVWRAWLITLALGLVMLPVNWALNTNFMYVCGPPARASLIDYLGPWPWSLAGLALVGLLILGVWYLPFFLLDRIQARAARRDAPAV